MYAEKAFGIFVREHPAYDAGVVFVKPSGTIFVGNRCYLHVVPAKLTFEQFREIKNFRGEVFLYLNSDFCYKKDWSGGEFEELLAQGGLVDFYVISDLPRYKPTMSIRFR